MMYIRITGDSFGFYTDEVHTIEETDVEISQEDYGRFFLLQSTGTHFRLKESIEGAKTLFDFVEEYQPIQVELPSPPEEDYKSEIEKLKQMIYLLEQKINK